MKNFKFVVAISGLLREHTYADSNYKKEHIWKKKNAAFATKRLLGLEITLGPLKAKNAVMNVT